MRPMYRTMLASYLPSSRDLAYISTTFAYALMHNIFSFYYVKIFLNFYHVTAWWFQFSQVLFMIWNTLNDPLFGYFQDNSSWHLFRNRRYSILFGAPFYGLSFLVAWFPFGSYGSETPAWVVGIHLISALCLYDTMFTFVLLAHCSLFAEMTVEYRARLNMKWWSVIAHLCAGVAVPLANHMSDNLNSLSSFRVTCVGIACASTLCMIYTGLRASTVYEEKAGLQQAEKISQGSIVKLTMQILSERDFHGFVWMNFLHQFHSAFLSNFASIFIDFIVPGLSTQFLNMYYILLWSLPPMTIIIFRKYIEIIGYYRIIRVICIAKIILSAFVWKIGQASYVFLWFLIVDSMFLHSVINLYDMVLADIADKDCKVHNRKQPVSSMIFGTNALITKPAISLSPMIIVAILNANGYQQAIKDIATVKARSLLNIELSSIIFNLACGVPFLVGLLQTLSWSFYTIRHSHIRSNQVADSEIELGHK